jgi:hypothetical protein
LPSFPTKTRILGFDYERTATLDGQMFLNEMPVGKYLQDVNSPLLANGHHILVNRQPVNFANTSLTLLRE